MPEITPSPIYNFKQKAIKMWKPAQSFVFFARKIKAMPTTQRNELKEKIHEIIFEADTPAGKAFDIALLVLIMASVLVVMLESVQRLQTHYSDFFYALEWAFTLVFTIEYLLRLYCVYRPAKYAGSFFGIIPIFNPSIWRDFLSRLNRSIPSPFRCSKWSNFKLF